ncbi:MAG: acetate/propionate family kinase [Pseudomonadota bacterium]|nr:acetate/propionate family kinase [Pseudomonadota bacterium]
MSSKYVLVINCGSSSVKFAVFEINSEHHIYHGLVDNINTDSCHLSFSHQNSIEGYHIPNATIEEALKKIIAIIKNDSAVKKGLTAIGHRVVHGGLHFKKATKIDQNNILKLKEISSLAPLHNPSNIAGIETCLTAFPKIKNIAVFDTAFHSSIPEIAATYAIDRDIATKYGIKKYGFHGISHNFISQKFTEITQNMKPNLISIHLGNGASICAIKAGESVDTSMGFTPLAGLVMGTRSGDIDPGIHQYLASKLNISLAEITDTLNKRSGLRALSRISHDMRKLEAAYVAGDKDAKLAIDIFCYSIAKYIASYMVPLQNCDGIIFTGGIGENSALIRFLVIQHLKFLSLNISEKDNNHNGACSNHIISQETSAIPVYVFKTNEELMIAKLAVNCKK